HRDAGRGHFAHLVRFRRTLRDQRPGWQCPRTATRVDQRLCASPARATHPERPSGNRSALSRTAWRPDEQHSGPGIVRDLATPVVTGRSPSTSFRARIAAKLPYEPSAGEAFRRVLTDGYYNPTISRPSWKGGVDGLRDLQHVHHPRRTDPVAGL